MLSGPAEAPEPVAKFSSDGKKLTKAQRKKLKKKRRKEQRKNDDSGVETDQSDSNKKERAFIHLIKLFSFHFSFKIWPQKKDTDKNLKVDIDYIAEEPALDPASLQFRKVFDAFRAAQILSAQEAVQKGFDYKNKKMSVLLPQG